MSYKKLVSAALTATTVLWMVGAASLPLANAQSTSSIQAQIAALLAQIQQLQAQLGTSGTATASTGASYDYTRDLTVGSTGADVSALQSFLIAQGDLTAVSAPTGYFGSLTQAALAKYQAANGITPSAGYFGPKTRAFLASLTTTTTSTSTGTTTTTTGTTAPATGLSVSLASDNPAAGSLVSSASGSGGGSAARIPVLSVDLTAGSSGAVTVSQLVFQKTGVVSDAAISNAYLVQNGQVVAQYASLSSGVLTFSGLDLSIPAGQTEEYQLAVGLSSGSVNAGNTVSFSLPSATDVTAFDSNNNAVTPTGSFPFNGNVFTVTTVNNPALASLSISSSSIGTQVTAGTQGNIVGSWTLNAEINPVYLENINFHVIGSANVANLQNVKLLVNGVQVGTTLSSVPANGEADFNLGTNVKLNTGSNNLQVVADVLGSPNMNFQFEILNSYDVLAVDSQYNVPIAVSNTGGIGTQVSILPGQITASQDANTPTGNISKGMSNVTLAKFDFYAAGEPVKVQWLDFNINLGGVSATSSLSSEIQNVQLVDDAGNQVGTTITTPPSSNTCTPTSGSFTAGVGATAGSNTLGSTVDPGSDYYSDCFGSSNSPINYTIPANTTRVLSLEANVQSTANFSTITANLSGDTNNLQGQISSNTGSTSPVNGVTLTLVGSSLQAAQNNALGAQNVSAGTTGLRIGSYSLSASSAEGVNVNTVSIQLTPGTTTWIGGSSDVAFQNLKLEVNGVQFGTTQGVLSPGATYVFSGSPINVPAGQTVNVDVYADTLSNATGTYSPATDLTGYTGSGQVSYDSVTASGSTTGQSIVFNGQPAITVAADSSNPPAGLVAQNTTGDTLAVYRFTETSNVESVKVTQLNVDDIVASGTDADFSNLQLYNGSTLLGTANAPMASGTSDWVYTFSSFSNPLIVPQGGSVSITLKGNAGSYTGGSITDGSTSTFEIVNGSPTVLVARGETSNKVATVNLSNADGNAQTVLRSIQTVTGSPVSTLPPASFQQIGSITFTSNASGDTMPRTLNLTFNNSSGTFLSTVALHDVNGNNVTSTGVATSSYTGSVVSWTFSTSTPLDVTAGNSYTLTIWANLSTIAAQQNTSQSLTAQIANATDYAYYDGSSGFGTSQAPVLVTLPTNLIPITVVTLTTPVGGQF